MVATCDICFSFIVLAALLLPASECLQCFHCSSLVSEHCYDPWKYIDYRPGVLNISTIGDLPCKSCTIYSYKIQDWTWKKHVVRSCSASKMNDQCDRGSTDTKSGSHCACNTNLCNAGSPSTLLPTDATLLGLAFFGYTYRSALELL